MIMQLLISSLKLRSHGIGRIFLRSHGPTLTVRKFRRLAAQISVWTDRKCWTVSCEQSVLSNLNIAMMWYKTVCSRVHTHQFACAVLKLMYHHLHDHVSHNRCWREFVFTVKQSQGNKVIGEWVDWTENVSPRAPQGCRWYRYYPFWAVRQKKCEIKRLTREDEIDFVRRQK